MQAPTYREMPLSYLVESPTNPRRFVEQAAMADLVASIRERGILTPLIVRQLDVPQRESGTNFEIIAGHRRYRAAREIGLDLVPVVVRDVDDAAALEDATVENLQRAAVHPLDEADGYRQLMALDPAYTPEAIAARVGKSPIYVHQRLRLADLVPEVKKAFLSDRITAGHATLIARVPQPLQAQALEACFETLFHVADPTDRKALVSLPRLKRWIEDHTKIDITNPETAQLFPGLAEQLLQLPAEDGQALLEVSTSWGKASDVPPGVLPRTRYHEIVGRPCKSARPALVVHGDDHRAEIIQVCADKKCPTHCPAKPPKPKPVSPEDRQQAEERQRAEQDRWTRLRVAALKAVADIAKARSFDVVAVLEELLNEAFRDAGEIKAVLGGAITLKNLGAAVAVGRAMENDWSVERFRDTVAKQYHLDLDAIEKSLGQSARPAAAAKKAPKKPATPAKKKAAPKKSGKKR